MSSGKSYYTSRRITTYPKHSAVLGVAKHVSDSVEIQVSQVGKAIALAGYLGSAKLPPAVNPSTVTTEEGHKFTLINNAGALKLAKESI